MTLDRARLLAIFREELEERRLDLEHGLLELEADPDAERRRELVRDLFRAAHSLKGAAASAGLRELATITAQLEDILSRLRDDDMPPDNHQVARILQLVDHLVVPHPDPSADGPEGQDPDTDRKAAGVAPSSPSPGSARASRSSRAGSRATPSVRARVSADDLDAAIAAAGELRLAVDRLRDLPARAARAVSGVQQLGGSWRALHALLAGSQDDAEVRAAVRRLDEELRRLTMTTRDLADRTAVGERRLLRTASDVNRTVGRLGLVAFGDICAGLERLVRDVATASGKDAHLRTMGDDLELDRVVAAALRDPLVHLIRNAVDHGIEPPAVRESAGKPASGRVHVQAQLESGHVRITVSDDGAGIDMHAVEAAAAARGIEPSGDPAVVFTPGLTTATHVSEVSGRGVGLDAVRADTEAVGGSVTIRTEPGLGTTIELTLPATLSIMPALIARVAGEDVALPMTAVRHVVRVPVDELVSVDGRASIAVDGRMVGLTAAGWLLGLATEPRFPQRNRTVEAVVVGDGGGAVALAVDEVSGEQDVILKPLGRRLGEVAGVLGASVLNDGRPAVVLNPATWARRAMVSSGRHASATTQAPAIRPRVLLAEDTVTTRTLERSILEAAGYDVIVAVDGAEALRLLEQHGADLVISDVDMPNVDGFVLCSTIRASDRFADLPVVLVTSLSDERSRARGVQVGANAYIVKSAFEQASLLETIERLL